MGIVCFFQADAKVGFAGERAGETVIESKQRIISRISTRKIPATIAPFFFLDIFGFFSRVASSCSLSSADTPDSLLFIGLLITGTSFSMYQRK